MCYKILDSDLLCEELMLAWGKRHENHLPLLHSSHSPPPKCQTHQPVAAHLRLCCAWDIFTSTQTGSCPAAKCSCSRCTSWDHPSSRHTVQGIFGCALTDIAGYKYVSSRSGSFHCVYAACFSAEVFHNSSLPQITSLWQWDKKNLAQLFLKLRLD